MANVIRVAVLAAFAVLSGTSHSVAQVVSSARSDELDSPGGIAPEIERRDAIEQDETLPSILPKWYPKYREWRQGVKERLKLELTMSLDIVAQGYASEERAFGTMAGDLTLSGRYSPFSKLTDNASFLGFRLRERRALFGVDPPSEIRPRTGLLWGTVDGFTDAGFQLPDFYFNQELFDERLLLRYGQLNLDSSFDGHKLSGAKRYFLSQAFSDNPGVAFPSFGAGAVVRWKSSHHWDLKIGASNVQSSSQNDEVSFKLDSKSLFEVAQIGLDLDGADGGLGRIQITGWHSDALPDEGLEEGQGVSITLEQDGLPGDARAFARYAYADGKATRVDQFFALGFGQPLDAFNYWGIGVSAGRSVEDKKTWQGAFEIFYRRQVAQEFQITPDVQIIVGDSLDGLDSFRVVFGLRGGLTF